MTENRELFIVQFVIDPPIIDQTTRQPATVNVACYAAGWQAAADMGNEYAASYAETENYKELYEKFGRR